MKRSAGLGVALGVVAAGAVALAVSFSGPVSADPSPPPNDNVCICHNTEWNNKNSEGKIVEICVDPNSNTVQAHQKHGDLIVFDEGCPAEE